MTTIGKIVLFTVPRRGGTGCHAGPCREVPGLVRRQREAALWARDISWFPWERGEVGQAGSGPASLSNTNQLWA